MRTLIYLRVSTEDQIEKYGLPVQLRVCREYAAQHGLEIAEVISDEGVSGATMERAGLTRVRDLVHAGEADVVLMVDVDRLSRELAHLLILKPEIEKRARLEFVAAKFEDSPSGRLFFGIRGVIGQYERELTRERTMRGQKERASCGLIVGGRVPYGYQYEPGAERRYSGRLLVEDGRAAVVREIYAWYLSGLSIRAIAARLRERAAPTWGGKPWGHTSVRWILASETYAGIAWWRSGTARVALPVPALLERGMWEQAQSRLAENAARSGAGRPSERHLLAGMVQCACGRKMYGEYHTKRKYAGYRCAGRAREHHFACRCAVSGRDLDRAVWQEIEKSFSDPTLLRALLVKHRAALQDQGPARSEHLRGQVARLKRKEETALSLLLDPDFAADRAAIKQQYRALQAERLKAESELRRIEASERSTQVTGDWVEAMTQMLREDLRTRTELSERREFLKGLDVAVRWDGVEAQVHCFLFSPKLASASPRTGQFPPLEVVLTARLAA